MIDIFPKLHLFKKFLCWLRPHIGVGFIRILAVLLLLLPIINLKSGTFAYIVPSLDSAIIFFWTIANPSLFNPYWLIILGFYVDIILGLPTGFNAFVYLVFYYSLNNLSKYFINTSFYAYWGGFAFFSLFFFVAKYLLMMIYDRSFFIPKYLVVQWLILQFVYPYLHLLFSKIR